MICTTARSWKNLSYHPALFIVGKYHSMNFMFCTRTYINEYLTLKGGRNTLARGERKISKSTFSPPPKKKGGGKTPPVREKQAQNPGAVDKRIANSDGRTDRLTDWHDGLTGVQYLSEYNLPNGKGWDRIWSFLEPGEILNSLVKFKYLST